MLQKLGRLHLYLTLISFWACWRDLNDPKYQVSCIATSSSPPVGIQIQPIARMAKSSYTRFLYSFSQFYLSLCFYLPVLILHFMLYFSFVWQINEKINKGTNKQACKKKTALHQRTTTGNLGSWRNTKFPYYPFQNLLAPCKGLIRFPESGKSLLVESRIWENFAYGIRNITQGIPNPITFGIQNPSSTDKYWNPVSGIRNLQRGIQNPGLSQIPLHGANLCSSI